MNDCEQFADAVVKNNLALADKMLKKNQLLGICARDRSGWPPMHSAVMRGYVRMLRVLARHGVSVNMAYIYEFTPLELAVATNHVQVVKELIRLGAHVDESKSNNLPMTCRLCGHYNCQPMRCAESIAGVDYGVAETPLQHAIRNKHQEIVNCIRIAWTKTVQQKLFGICVALAPLQLPAYVLLWIIDWLPEYSQKPEIRKIRLIQGVVESVRLIDSKQT